MNEWTETPELKADEKGDGANVEIILSESELINIRKFSTGYMPYLIDLVKKYKENSNDEDLQKILDVINRWRLTGGNFSSKEALERYFAINVKGVMYKLSTIDYLINPKKYLDVIAHELIKLKISPSIKEIEPDFPFEDINDWIGKYYKIQEEIRVTPEEQRLVEGFYDGAYSNILKEMSGIVQSWPVSLDSVFDDIEEIGRLAIEYNNKVQKTNT